MAEGQPAAGPRVDGFAIVSALCGFMAFLLALTLWLAPLGALLGGWAVALGIMALARAKRYSSGSRVLAIAGVASGAVAILLGAAVILVVALYG